MKWLQLSTFLQYFLRIPADNDDFRNRGTNWKMLFYFESFKYPASPHLWHFTSFWNFIMFMAREILRTLWRHSATDDPGPDVKPHIRPGERITQYLSTETEINWNIQIIFCSSRFAFSSGQINSPLIPWFPPHRSSHCVEISSFYCFCGSVLVGDTEVRPCDPVKVKLKIFIVIVMTDQRPGEGWGIFKKWLFIPTKLLEHH